MGGAKPWQLILVGAGLVGAIVLFILFNPFADPVEAQLDKRVVLADVATGELFQVSTKERGIIPPLRNPGTNKLALLPVEKNESSGEWYVTPRWQEVMVRVEVEPEAMEEGTGVIRAAYDKPVTIKPIY